MLILHCGCSALNHSFGIVPEIAPIAAFGFIMSSATSFLLLLFPKASRDASFPLFSTPAKTADPFSCLPPLYVLQYIPCCCVAGKRLTCTRMESKRFSSLLSSVTECCAVFRESIQFGKSGLVSRVRLPKYFFYCFGDSQ
jgi:hypothetical protein